MPFVDFTNSQDLIDVDPVQITHLITSVLEDKKVKCDEISLHFVSIEEISQLHADFFNDPTPTDCITFPIDDEEEKGYRLLGEIFVCPEVAIAAAKEFETTVSQELSLYIVHGILHLLGYDDIEEEDRIIMRNQEQQCMQILRDKKQILSVSFKDRSALRK